MSPEINNISAQLYLRLRASQMAPISAADDPQIGRDGLDVGADSAGVGTGIAFAVGTGVAGTSRFMSMPASP